MHRYSGIPTALYFIALLHAAPAFSQPYPSKPVRIVVPSVPGGGTDIAARTLARHLTREWAQQVLVDNRPSPAGNVAAEAVWKAPADGYTLLMTTSAIAIVPPTSSKLTYDRRELVAVGAIMASPLVLLVHPTLPASSVKDLVALARAQPEKLTYGHAGSGSAEHVCAELFRHAAGVLVKGTAYKAAMQPGTLTLLPEVQYAFSEIVHAMPHVKAAHARALAITTARRYDLMPNVPTVGETLPGFEYPGWQALFARVRVPQPVLSGIEAGVGKAMQTRELTEELMAQGLQPVAAVTTANALRGFLPQELARWGKLVRELDIRIE